MSGESVSGFAARPVTVRYDRITILLHWLIAAAVVLQWIGGRTIDWFPKGPLKIDARSAHIVVGAALASLFLVRLYWRGFRGKRLPPAQEGVLEALSIGVRWSLLALLLAVLALGLSCAWLRGDSLFGLARIPALGDYTAPARHALVNRITDLHGLGANLILCLAAFHAAAALVHRFYWRDKVLARML